MLRCFLVDGKERCVEDRVNFPLRRDPKAEGCSRYDLFDFKRTSSLHLEFLGPIHVKIGGFQPDFLSYFPWGVFGGYPFFHSLLG